MAIKALKRPKTEFLNQSFEIFLLLLTTIPKVSVKSNKTIKAPVTLNDDAFASLSDDERMEYEERSAIMEYDGGLSREEAERQGLERILKRREAKS